MIVARFYGSTGQTDSFFFALIIPEMLRTLIVSGAVASVFIPLMTEIQRAGKEHEARRLAGMMISFISLLAIVAVAICELFAPGLVRFSEVLSFAGEPLSAERLRLTSELIRILLPVVLLVGLWGLMGGILNALDNFHVPGLSPVAWNGFIIIFLLFVGYRGDVHDVAWAFVIGHFIQVLFHIPSLWKAGIRPVAINWRHPMLMRFLQLAPVAVLAYAAPAVNAFVGQGIALNLSESSASSLMYAFRIQQLPIAIFGVSVATAIFPTLSRHAVAGLGKDVVATLARGLRMTCLATLPAMVFFVVLPNETIRLLLERGAFTSTNTGDVSLALYWYSWAMLPMSLLLLTARTFFSEKDMRTPALIGIFTIIIYYLLSLLFSRIYGFSGIAMTGGAVSWLTLIISIFILHRRYSRSASLFKAIGAKSPLHMIIAGLAEALVLLGYRHFAGSLQGTWALLGAIVLATIIGGAAYLLVLRLLGNEDLSSTLRMLFRRR
jgi:putative peptidoglycan lipid II flippase